MYAGYQKNVEVQAVYANGELEIWTVYYIKDQDIQVIYYNKKQEAIRKPEISQGEAIDTHHLTIPFYPTPTGAQGGFQGSTDSNQAMNVC